ncbi:MAG TPA: hypothetical protein VGV93_05115 [Acidimicrobiales bacterium]|nr:hypothetical protein [Acidimicrobiales bacterium]
MSEALDVLAGLVLEDGRRWGEAAEPWQWTDAQAVLDPGHEDPRSHFLTRPRGRSKTSDLGGVATAAHERKEEEAGLRNTIAQHKPSGYRCSVIADAWVPVLAERLAEENRAELEPQLAGLSAEVREKTLRTVERDAEREARDRVSGLWRQLDGEAAEKVNAAQARLSALTLGADPASSAIRTSENSSLEEGRRRGREHRKAREARADAFTSFRSIG